MDEAALVDLRSALGGGGEDEFGVGECCLEFLIVWKFGQEKQWAERLSVRAATVEDDESLFVCEGGWDNERIRVCG